MVLSDTWFLSLGDSMAWSMLPLPADSQRRRYAHVAVYDPLRDRMIISSGGRFTFEAPGTTNTYALPLVTLVWAELQPASWIPSARQSHAGVYDASRDQLVVFGGRDQFFLLDDAVRLVWYPPTDLGDSPQEMAAPLNASKPLIRILPNPSVEATLIRASLAVAGDACIEVVNLEGRRVRVLHEGNLP